MSSLSTLPKGDSAWLLRKAIERIMQQVSVLETNIGSSTTGNSANTQIIFNDNGVLRGDSDLTFNTALNRLIATNLESTAALTVGTSATITGDLTVDTSTLAVNSSADTVSIAGNLISGTQAAGTSGSLAIKTRESLSTTTRTSIGAIRSSGTSYFGHFVEPSSTVSNQFNAGVTATTGGGAWFIAGDGSTSFNALPSAAQTLGSAVTLSERYKIDSTGVATWSNVGGVAGTAMTLNSTGLLVGTTATSYGAAGRGVVVAGGSASAILGLRVGSTDTGYLFADATKVEIGYLGVPLIFNNGGIRMTLDTAGNVGVGVTPSAWGSGYKVIQGQIGGFALSNDNSSNNQFRLSSNAYFDTTDSRWEYYGSSTATAYEQRAGEHRFFNAASGTANNAITFTQAMTLDASGRLLVGKAASNFATVGSEIKANGSFTSTQSDSTNGSTAWDTYSTGASAYRFYVGMAGTVFATNTTISAISDARFKENIQDLDVGLGAILALKPRKFDWKAGKGKDIKGDRGFIAQEFEQVFPNLVDEWRDNAPEGEAPYKSVRQDLIPVLVKAIQELTARVQTLEAR
jgi:hypothetical protein